MYTIEDVVEVGHMPLIGGTMNIKVNFNKVPTVETKENVYQVIDYLDHCLITDNKEAIAFSERYFLLDKSVDLFSDVFTVLYNFLSHHDIQSITVKLGKESFTNRLVNFSNILDYRNEG